MAEKLLIEVKGAGLDPTRISHVQADAEVEVSAKNLSIEKISAAIDLKSRLDKGSLDVNFAPYFRWGFSISKGPREVSLGEDYKKKLEELGLDDTQVKKVMAFLEKDVVPELPSPDIVVVEDTLKRHASRSKASKNLAERLSIPLPGVNIDVSPVIDVDGPTINDIQLKEKTTIESSNIDTQGLKLDDFAIETPAAEAVSFERAEISSFVVKPLQLNALTLKNLNTAISIPKIGSTNIPITIETKNAVFPIKLTLVNWKKGWRAEAHFHVLWKKVTAWAEWGFELKIVLYYTWQLKLLKAVIVLKNAFLNTISISLKLPRILFSGISVGLVNVARLVCRKAQGKKVGTGQTKRQVARK